MVLFHAMDSWTREADRTLEAYYTLLFVAGVASPLFLFLAGVAMALSASAKGRQAGGHAAGAAIARRRGWEIFVLGLIFRVQSQLLGQGPLGNLLRVDMLNVMGLAMVAAARVWGAAPSRRTRLLLFAAATGAIAMITPLVRQAAWLAVLPDPVEAYLRPTGPYSAFVLFPWAGFLFAGVLVGDLIDAVRTVPAAQPRLQTWICLGGGAGVLLAWWASLQPPLYDGVRFWSDSPTFFFIRLGLVVLLVPAAWIAEQLCPARWLEPVAVMGRSSLFVYWIHVEMVYGVLANPVKRALPLTTTLASAAALIGVLYLVVLLKNRLLEDRELRGPFRILAPVLR
jgi:uncharacterized membrane protein